MPVMCRQRVSKLGPGQGSQGFRPKPQQRARPVSSSSDVPAVASRYSPRIVGSADTGHQGRGESLACSDVDSTAAWGRMRLRPSAPKIRQLGASHRHGCMLED